MTLLTRKTFSALAVLCSISCVGLANNTQDFSGISYSNPAELTLFVKDAQLILGDELLSPSPNITFNGRVTVPDPSPQHNNVVVSGTANNIDQAWFPYARAALRLSSQWVLGFDVTQPFKSEIAYPTNSAARYSTTVSELHLVDYAPNIAYQFTGTLSKLAVGAGFDAMNADLQLNSMYPSLPTPTMPFGAGSDNTFANQGSGWGYGWHAGALYHLFQPTILGLSYFSAVNQHFSGISSFTGFPSNPNFYTELNLPATTIFSLTQFVSKNWSWRLKATYSQWSSLQSLTLHNTAGPSSSGNLLFDYNNSWRYDIGTRYELTPKLALGALFAYDETPTVASERVLGLPGFNQKILGGSVEYKLTDKLTLQGIYGHVFSTTVPIDSVDPNTGTITNGTVVAFGNLVGLQLTANV